MATYRFRLRRRTLVTRHAARSRVALTVDWTFVEGEIVTDSVGGRRKGLSQGQEAAPLVNVV